MSESNKQIIRQNLIELLDLYRDDNWVPLAYTQTFKASKLSNSSFDTQHTYKCEDLVHAMQEVVNFVFVPEATVEGNVHYHGIIISIKKRKKRKWYNETLPTLKRMGFLKLKKISDMSRWIDYMLKDFEDFEYMIKNKSYPNNYLTSNYNASSCETHKDQTVDTKDVKDADEEVIFHTVRIRKVKKNKKDPQII